MASQISKPVLIFLILGMVLTSVVNTISTKVLFTLQSTGANGEREMFNKPWFGAWNMLTAMMLVGIVDRVWKSIIRPTGPPPDMDEPLINESPEVSATPHWKKVVCVAIPAFFDLTATAVMIIGLILIPASICNMLRGSCIIFSALFSIALLKDSKIESFQWFALFLCTAGIALVGIAEWCAGAGSGSVSVADSVFGMVMVVLAQIVQALQLVAEEYFLKEVDLPMMEMVGWEGFWGVVMMILIFYPSLYLLPGSDHGHMEDVFDTFDQFRNSSAVAGCSALYIFSCATFNATGIGITGALSAVHRIILVAVATMLIWMTGLFVHYYINPDLPFGEVWYPMYSWLQLCGFIVLILGQMVYGGLLRVPGFVYPAKEKIIPAMSPGAEPKVFTTPSRK